MHAAHVHQSRSHRRENIKAITEQCGTSEQMIEQHYGCYISSDFGQRLMAELGAETEMKTEISEGDFANTENDGESMASPIGLESAPSSTLKDLQALSMRTFKKLQRCKSA